MRRSPRRLDPFKDSLWRLAVDSVTSLKVKEKSCPSCSKKAGHAVYLPESAFGDRVMESGKVEIQPWCRDCR